MRTILTDVVVDAEGAAPVCPEDDEAPPPPVSSMGDTLFQQSRA